MTRAERAALREQRLKADLHATRKERAQLAAQERERARVRQHKRRVQVGLLAEEAGLLVWDDPTLARLFALLTPLTQLPSPEAVLESLLADPVVAGSTAAVP